VVSLWSGEHMIMLNVMWRHFDQSAKQLIVGHTTITPVFCICHCHALEHSGQTSNTRAINMTAQQKNQILSLNIHLLTSKWHYKLHIGLSVTLCMLQLYAQMQQTTNRPTQAGKRLRPFPITNHYELQTHMRPFFWYYPGGPVPER